MLTAVSNSENYKEVPSSRALKTIEEYPETLLHFFPDGQFSEEDRDLLSRSIRYINLDDPSTHNAINKLSGYLEKIKNIFETQAKLSKNIDELQKLREETQAAQQLFSQQRETLEENKKKFTDSVEKDETSRKEKSAEVEEIMKKTEWTQKFNKKYLEWGQHGMTVSFFLAGAVHYCRNCSAQNLTQCALDSTAQPSSWILFSTGTVISISCYQVLSSNTLCLHAMQKQQEILQQQKDFSTRLNQFGKEIRTATDSSTTCANNLTKIAANLDLLNKEKDNYRSQLNAICTVIMTDTVQRQLKILKECDEQVMLETTRSSIGQNAMLTILNSAVTAIASSSQKRNLIDCYTEQPSNTTGPDTSRLMTKL